MNYHRPLAPDITPGAAFSKTQKRYRRRQYMQIVVAYLIAANFLGSVAYLAPKAANDYVGLAPGPARDAEKLTSIESRTYSSHGSFYLTTALVTGPQGLSASEFLAYWIDPSKRIIPKEQIFPPQLSEEEADEYQAAEMVNSQNAAAIAAVRELGLPLRNEGVRVREVEPDVPAAKVLAPGDRIVRVADADICGPGEIGEQLDGKKVGSAVPLTVIREDRRLDLQVPTVAHSEKQGKVMLGIVAEQSKPELPFEIKIATEDIGGPSAGLVFALSIYDLLIPLDLTGGKKIAGTGTIECNGKVGEIGAVEQKVRGAEAIHAEVFIVPKAELRDAQRAVRTNMKVIGVSTLKEAIAALKKLR